MILDSFNILTLKINLKKYYFNIFLNIFKILYKKNIYYRDLNLYIYLVITYPMKSHNLKQLCCEVCTNRLAAGRSKISQILALTWKINAHIHRKVQ
jgi:hypothetical protein